MATIDPKELYKTDLKRIKAAKELTDIYKNLAGVNADIGKKSAEQVHVFEDQLDIAEQLAENEKDIFTNKIYIVGEYGVDIGDDVGSYSNPYEIKFKTNYNFPRYSTIWIIFQF